MVVSTAFLCEVLGVHRKALTRWARKGMPKLARGQWHLGECVRWLLSEVAIAEEDTADESSARRALLEAQTVKMEIEIGRLRAELYDAADVHELLDRLAAILMAALNSIPARGAVHAGKTPGELEDALDLECAAVASELRAALRTLGESEDPGTDVQPAPET